MLSTKTLDQWIDYLKSFSKEWSLRDGTDITWIEPSSKRKSTIFYFLLQNGYNHDTETTCGHRKTRI